MGVLRNVQVKCNKVSKKMPFEKYISTAIETYKCRNIVYSYSTEKYIRIENREQRHGVAILVTPAVAGSVLDFVPLNDRAMLIKKQTSHRILNIIQMYAPTGDRPDDHVELFYSNIEELMRTAKKGLHAKIGAGQEAHRVGRYELETGNTRGDRLAQFCSKQDSIEESEATWLVRERTINNIQEQQLGFIQTNKKQGWMTQEILSLMDERRKHKDQNQDKSR
ncbi:hypothetical protein HUJ05_013217 [Dendroctonus ponderosae]|nr:hypothetical protein HUJ05_013217 [Dendroctonus ponderosae]